MSNFTITIEAPAICEAIKLFAAVMSGKQINAPAVPQTAAPIPTPVILPSIPTAAPAPVPATPAPQYVPAPIPTTTTPAPVYAAPAPVPAIPTAAAPTYTLDQLAVAATQLMDANRKTDLINLLKSFGVAALTQLPKEQYGAFATALREMGAKI